MNDRNAQRPVYLIRVALGQSRTTDLESFSQATALLRADKIPFKVVEATGGDLGPHDVLVIAEEYRAEAFAIALAYSQPSVIYLAFDRVAYERTRTEEGVLKGNVLGQFKAVPEGFEGAEVFFDRNRNQAFSIV